MRRNITGRIHYIQMIILLFLFIGNLNNVSAQLFRQDFNGTSSVYIGSGGTRVVPSGSYVDASSPGTSKWNYVATNSKTASGIAFNTSSSASTVPGTIDMMAAGGTDNVAGYIFSRTTPIASISPTALKITFNMKCEVTSNSSSAPGKFFFQVGNSFSTSGTGTTTGQVTWNSGTNNIIQGKEPDANVFAGFSLAYISTSAGANLLKNDGVLTTPLKTAIGTAFNTWTIIINKSGASLSYTDPQSGTSTVANNAMDIWIGTTLAGDEVAAITTTATLDNFKFGEFGIIGKGRTTWDWIQIDDISPSSCTAPDSKTVSGTTSICSGTSTDITLASSQSGVTYQLYAGASASGSAVSGTGSNLTWSVSPSTTTTYTVKTTTAGGYCETTMSGSAEVTVNAATSISSQSTATQSKFVGESFNPMTVTAAGTGTLSYQWKSSDDEATNTSGDDANVGTNSNSFTPSSASAGTKYYYCVVTGDCGSATSAVSGAIITNNTVPTVVLTSGSNSTSVNVNAAMTSAVYTYSYVGDDANVLADWYTDNTYATTTTAPSGLSITKDTEANIVTVSGTPANGVYGTLYYKLIVNETNGNSIEGTITVNVPTPTITLSSTASTNAQTIKANTAIANITYTVINASGATVGTLPAGLSGVYDNGTFTISGTIDIAATLGTANYTVTATPYTGYSGSAVTASGSVVVKSATAKEILYLTATSTPSALDTKLYPSLNSNVNYWLTVKQAAASAPLASSYNSYDLIVINVSSI